MREATSGILVHPRISESSCGHLANKYRPSTLELIRRTPRIEKVRQHEPDIASIWVAPPN